MLKLEITKEPLYGGMTRGKRFHYVAVLNGERIASGKTREEAEQNALKDLADAHCYWQSMPIVRVAVDGAVIVFTQTSETTAMYSFHRAEKGYQGGGSCIGTMTDGYRTYSTLREYADYTVGRYNECVHVEVAS